MKVLVHSLLVVPLLCACGGSEDETTQAQTEQIIVVDEAPKESEEIVNKFIIEDDVCGIFNVGDKVPALPDELMIRRFTETSKNSEGKEVEEIHNVIFNRLEDVVELLMDQGSSDIHEERVIKEMMVISNYYETPEEIRVGSTIEDLVATYPGCSFAYVPAIERYFAETPDLEKVQFIFDVSDAKRTPSGSADKIAMRKSDFQDGAKISKIRIF